MPALLCEMQAQSTFNFRFLTCLPDRNHIPAGNSSFNAYKLKAPLSIVIFKILFQFLAFTQNLKRSQEIP